MKGTIAVLMVVIFIVAGMTGCSDETTGPDPEPTNHAPDAPTINTAAGAPTDGESDCPLSQELYWQCSDPDGDDLTYDVHFGQTDPPAAVSTDQVAMLYDPGALENSTTYYWQIVAEDPDGETTSSDVWSFTTVALAVETVSRLFTRFQDEGLLQVERKHIQLQDLDGLRAVFTGSSSGNHRRQIR